MSDRLYDPRTHSDWLSPHSIEWYAHLGEAARQYSYPWNRMTTEPNGETMFEQEVMAMVTNKTVLDIGCGHGEFTKRWSGVVKKIVGLDGTDDFVQVGRTDARQNVSFVVANTKNSLPFATAAFDCAYNRRGPTSAYLDVKRVIKSGGRLLGLHPGDRLGEELSHWFLTLFEPRPAGTPVLDILKQRLAQGGLVHAEIRCPASNICRSRSTSSTCVVSAKSDLFSRRLKSDACRRSSRSLKGMLRKTDCPQRLSSTSCVRRSRQKIAHSVWTVYRAG
ncbi:class I SAM-dependent methyltransferase [Tumebacillus lipolyticus]|uniref:Class I SAM-dependent methyltransferase n=1 Tax=Tumebacillus lipolyticus TaxID=1280370 RepID=A0ABW4ZVY0_9BACL